MDRPKQSRNLLFTTFLPVLASSRTTAQWKSGCHKCWSENAASAAPVEPGYNFESCAVAGEVGKVGSQFIAHPPEYARSLGFGTGVSSRIFEIVVQPVSRAKKYRARLACIIADGDHVIEVLILKFVDML